jgi:hypothetical protein
MMPAEDVIGERPERRELRCRACGYRYLNPVHGECCSARCAAYLAEGHPSKAEQERLDDPFADRRRFGQTGVLVSCPGCGGQFESRGLRLCPDCYPALGDKADIKKYGNQSAAGRGVKKIACPECGGDVPAYGKDGRKSMAAYCSPRCQKRAARARVTKRNGGTLSPAMRDDTPRPESRIATPSETAIFQGGFVTGSLPKSGGCESCGKPVDENRNGRPRQYCGSTCRQRARRLREAAD